jgi:hypothetical protein
MTAPHDDERIVTDLLKAIEGDADILRPVLLDLRSLANGPVPVPSPELAKLLLGSTVVPLDTRRRTRRRAAIFSLAVIAAMGVGTTAAAAMSPEFRATTQHVITGIVTGLTPGATSSVKPTPTPEPSNGNAPVGSTSEHPTPHPTPTGSVSPLNQQESNGSSHGQSDRQTPAKPVLPVTPSQKDHVPGIPPTPQKNSSNGLIPGVPEGVVPGIN